MVRLDAGQVSVEKQRWGRQAHALGAADLTVQCGPADPAERSGLHGERTADAQSVERQRHSLPAV